MSMEIEEFYVTVGVQYGHREDAPKHPLGLHSDGYTVIEAPDEETARRMAFAIAGEQFSFLYDRARFIDDGTREKYHPRGEELRIAWQTPEQVRDILDHLERITDGLPAPVKRFRLEERGSTLKTADGENTEFAKSLQKKQEEIRDRFAEMGSPVAIRDQQEQARAEALTDEEREAEREHPFIWDEMGSIWKMTLHAHVHGSLGTCMKNSFGPRCTSIVQSDIDESGYPIEYDEDPKGEAGA